MIIFIAVFFVVYYGIVLLVLLNNKFESKKEFRLCLIPFGGFIHEIIKSYNKLK